MEVGTGSIAGSLRVALQVLSAHKRPVLEVYADVRNRICPPQSITVRGSNGNPSGETEHHHQDVFVEFSVVNIGGQRAENISFELLQDFTDLAGARRLSSLGIFNGVSIPQLPPAQRISLFQIDQFDLYDYDENGRPGPLKAQGLGFRVGFSGPQQGLNKPLRWWAEFRKGSQYSTLFRFNPQFLEGLDLPPAEYTRE